ncbi:MAG: isoprenylcysteine carboxylmethyltransferase family protein, partial [Chloroflexi bacterium]|nr:isoprenylcysteine carboxylmethyltransferase family protein [Chloroflexota bacterium]
TGAYAWVRHPQYAGFLLVMVGFLLQWPTIPTLVMFPVLVVAYRRLAIAEEREVRALFGAEWDAYASRMPRFIPRLSHMRSVHASGDRATRSAASTVSARPSTDAPDSRSP